MSENGFAQKTGAQMPDLHAAVWDNDPWTLMFPPCAVLVWPMRLMDRVQRLRENARRWGWPQALQQLAFRVLQRSMGLHLHYVFRRAHVVVHRPPQELSGLEFRVLCVDELIRWAQEPRYGMVPGFVDHALARGDVCVGALENGALLGYTWWSSAPTRDQGDVWVTFAAGDNFGYHGFVLPEHRGRGIYEPLVMSCGESFMRNGIFHTVWFVAVHNVASLRVQDKVGIPRAGIAGYCHAFGRPLTFRSPGARRTGFRFMSAARLRQSSPLP